MFQRSFSENTPFLLVAIALLSLTANIVLADSVESRELWPCSDGQLGDIDWRSRVLDVLLPDAVSDTSFRWRIGRISGAFLLVQGTASRFSVR